MLLLASKGTQQWLVSLICQDPAQASGACHRSLQLLHLLERDGWQLQPIGPGQTPPGRLTTVRHGLTAALRHGPLQPLGIDSLRSQGHTSQSVAHLYSRFPNLRGVLLEGTGYGSLTAVAEWRLRGVRTVLVPANIESLAPNIGSWTHRNRDVAQRFADERRWWAMADAIFTISIEEAWWLQLHGIHAEVLPYYPAPKRQHELEDIRMGRTPDPAVGYLWLADFRNPANIAGVHELLTFLQQAGLPPCLILAVGHGSDQLQKTIPSSLVHSFSFRGPVTDAELGELQKRCVAQLIVHPPTSGRLTRVVDSALAGIPVVGNTMALKSDQHLFQDNDLISNTWPSCPHVIAQPMPSEAAESVFLAALES